MKYLETVWEDTGLSLTALYQIYANDLSSVKAEDSFNKGTWSHSTKDLGNRVIKYAESLQDMPRMYNGQLPVSDVAELEPGQFDGGVLENGAKQGVNSFQRVQYDGPCPITGLKFPVAISSGRQQTTPNYIPEERPYHFRIYALDTPIDLPPGVGRDTLLKKIDGHILATGELSTGYKSRKSMKCPTTDAKACLAKIEGLRK